MVFTPQFCILKTFEVKKLNQIKSNLTFRKCPQKMTRTASFGLGFPPKNVFGIFPQLFFSQNNPKITATFFR